jgi:hypothetical protein
MPANSENIIASLEMRMKCGIGKCGRGNVGEKYVCKGRTREREISIKELKARLGSG